MHVEISSVKYRNSPLVKGRVELSCIVFVSMPPTVLNEDLIIVTCCILIYWTSYRSECWQLWKWKKNSANLTRKRNVQIKNKRKSQETNAKKKIKLRKILAQSKDIRAFFATSNVQKSNDQTELLWKNEKSKN